MPTTRHAARGLINQRSVSRGAKCQASRRRAGRVTHPPPPATVPPYYTLGSEQMQVQGSARLAGPHFAFRIYSWQTNAAHISSTVRTLASLAHRAVAVSSSRAPIWFHAPRFFGSQFFGSRPGIFSAFRPMIYDSDPSVTDNVTLATAREIFSLISHLTPAEAWVASSATGHLTNNSASVDFSATSYLATTSVALIVPSHLT